MDLSLSNKSRIIAFVALLFVFNLLFLFAVPGNLHRFQNLSDDPMVPAFFRWGFSPTGTIVGFGISILIWAFYFSPLRKRFNEHSQLYIFGVALGALAGVVLRAAVLLSGK